MKRYYFKQNISIFISAIIIAFLYITMIGWKWQGKMIENILQIMTNYMRYLGLWIGIVSIVISGRYMQFVKGQQEGEFLYAIPVSRISLWKNQWIAATLTIIVSWVIAVLLFFVGGGSYLKTVQITWLLPSVIAYILLDIWLLTFNMWIQTRIKSSRMALITTFGGLFLIMILLREISKWMIAYLHDTGIGLFALIHNAVDTFLYSHQAMSLFYKAAKADSAIDRIGDCSWQMSRYGMIYVVITMILVVTAVLMIRDALRNSEYLPNIKKLPTLCGICTVWSVIFTIVNEVFMKKIALSTHNFILYCSEARINVHPELDIDNLHLSCFSFYEYNHWQFDLKSAIFILILSMCMTAFIVCVWRKRNVIFANWKRKGEIKG